MSVSVVDGDFGGGSEDSGVSGGSSCPWVSSMVGGEGCFEVLAWGSCLFGRLRVGMAVE